MDNLPMESSMMSIANSMPIDIGTSEQTKNQISMFLMAQAKNELNRIVKLVTFLDEVEAKYMDTAQELMTQYPDNLTLVQNIMETLEKSINRSNELLTQLLKDDKLNRYVIPQNSENSEENTSGITKESRDNIREFAGKMLSMVEQLNSKDDEAM